MTLEQLDTYFKELLQLDLFAKADVSLNGLQVGDRNQDTQRVAFAVDACLDSFERAAAWGAGLLVVHHGLFWGPAYALTGTAYARIKALVEHKLGLYAVHLPLDAHPVVGNNAVMAAELGLQELQPFGIYKGVAIGYRGVLAQTMRLEEVSQLLFGDDRAVLGRLPFGKQDIRSVGIISGGATKEVDEALALGLDLYITGDSDHAIYHRCLEAGINVIFGGHYQTETRGVSALAQRLRADTGLETCFIDLPTGL